MIGGRVGDQAGQRSAMFGWNWPEVEVSRSHTVSDGMYTDIKIIFVSLL